MPSEKKTFDEITLNANELDFSGGKMTSEQYEQQWIIRHINQER